MEGNGNIESTLKDDKSYNINKYALDTECVDAINREDTIRYLIEKLEESNVQGHYYGIYRAIERWVRELPSITPVEYKKCVYYDSSENHSCMYMDMKLGKWLDTGSLSCRCSICGVKNNRQTRFCPSCGAKMYVL